MKEQQVKKTFLPQDIVVLTVIFAAGAACFLLGEGWGGLGAKGLFRLKEISLSRENKNDILAYLKGSIDTVDLHSWQPGGALVDVYYRKGEDRGFARYFDYVDFSHGIEYPLYEVTMRQVSTLESFAIDKK